MKYKWKIENRYDNSEYGCSVGKRDFRSHREAVRDLIEEIKSDTKSTWEGYGLFEKDRTKTIITVEAYDEVVKKMN